MKRKTSHKLRLESLENRRLLTCSCGDVNDDGAVDALDIDLVSASARNEAPDLTFDLSDDGKVDAKDREILLGEIQTLLGDADLDGTVSFDDFLALSAGFGKEGGWAAGDFDGDGTVDFPDFLSLASNYGDSILRTMTFNWSKTLDPFAPGAEWVGPGQASDGDAVSVRLFDFVPGADGTTIERAIFEISGEGRETVSLLMSGTFTPGAEAGTGAIRMTGEQTSMLESTTENGLVTTAGEITYLNDVGERVTVTWEKTLNPFNPLAAWTGSGETSNGEAVSVRLFDFVPGADGTTIERAIFEVSGEGRDTVSMLLSGWFNPGTEPGTGSIVITGERRAVLESTSENGLITTAGDITIGEKETLEDSLETITWEKTLDPFAPGAVWLGDGQTDRGDQVSVRLFDFVPGADGTTIERAIFEISGEGRETVSLLMSGAFTPGTDPGTGAILMNGEQGSTLNSTTNNGLVTTAGEIAYTNDDGEVVTVTWAKTLDPFNPLASWAGAGQTADGEAISVRLFNFVPGADGTTIDRAIFEVSGEGRDTVSLLMSGEFTPGSEPGAGSILMTGEQGATLRSTTENSLITTAGEITFFNEVKPATTVGRFGSADEIGAANLITEQSVIEAAKLIKQGKRYSLSQVLEVESPTNPFVSHEVLVDLLLRFPETANDFFALAETLDSNFMHVGTQFDSLGHIGIGDDFYNGNTFDDVFSPTGLEKLGAEEVPPFFTRGVLVDVAAYKEVEILPPTYEITVEDLEGALAKQGTEIRAGDVVLFHTGWGTHYVSDPALFVETQPGIGLDVARQLASQEVVMVGADNVFVDVFPNPDPTLLLPVHQELLTKNGIYLLEIVKTEELARDQVYEFAFSFAPIRVEGATGSAAHPFAII